jgi:hypothetical protein
MTTDIKKSTEEYLKLFNACSIGVGDTVKVVRGWKSGDYGYYDAHGIGALPLKQNFIVKSKRYDRYYLDFEGFCFCLEAPFFALELVEKAKVTTPATPDDYLAFHNASGLKVGDSVRVVRKAEDREMGWGDIWSGHMDDCVDRTYKIIGDATSYGWELDNKWTFPTFVLQKVDSTPAPQPAPATEEIVINKDSVIVNGKVLTKKEIGKLYYRVVRGGKSERKSKKKIVKKLVPLVPAHNPDNLTPEQVGVSEGYRLLDEDEIKDRASNLCIEKWVVTSFKNPYWDDSRYQGNYTYLTYRTRLSREQLAKLK